MIVQACLNGARPQGYHPRLPVSAAGLAEDAAAVVRAGAGEFHLHVRDDSGRESLAPAAVDAILAAIERDGATVRRERERLSRIA